MAGDQVVQVPPDSTGKNIATYEKTEGGKTVQVQKVALAGHGPDDEISPLSTAPVGTESALPVRPIPSGIQAVSAAALPLPAGAATDAALSAILGGVGDAAVIGDASGSESAKLRGVLIGLETLRQEIRKTNQLLFLIASQGGLSRGRGPLGG